MIAIENFRGYHLDQQNDPNNYKSTHKSELPYRRETIGSQAFNLEYFKYSSEGEIYDDIVAYLGEYRFQLKKFNYEMMYAKGSDGAWALRDTQRGESLGTKAKRVLDERRFREDPTHREENEEIGIQRLQDQLRFATQGDTVYWMSPPGPREEGYGKYGFLYKGDVDVQEDGSLKLLMSAIRLEGDDLAPYINTLERLSGKSVDHSDADGFLSDPRLVRASERVGELERILMEEFSFQQDYAQNRDFEAIIGEINPLIHEVIDRIKYGDKREKTDAFNTLENYFLKLKKMYEEERGSGGKVIYVKRETRSLNTLIANYSYEPPKALGSCGSTAKSSSIGIGRGNFIDSLLKNGQEWFTCPKCEYKADGPIGNECPGCHITKEEFASEEGGTVCD